MIAGDLNVRLYRSSRVAQLSLWLKIALWKHTNTNNALRVNGNCLSLLDEQKTAFNIKRLVLVLRTKGNVIEVRGLDQHVMCTVGWWDAALGTECCRSERWKSEFVQRRLVLGKNGEHVQPACMPLMSYISRDWNWCSYRFVSIFSDAQNESCCVRYWT